MSIKLILYLLYICEICKRKRIKENLFSFFYQNIKIYLNIKRLEAENQVK